jgi:hypothetical protein
MADELGFLDTPPTRTEEAPTNVPQEGSALASIPDLPKPGASSIVFGDQGIQPKTFEEVQRVAKMYAISVACPKTLRGNSLRETEANVVVVLEAGRTLGLTPAASLAFITVINGKLCLWGDGMLAVVRRHPEFVDLACKNIEGKDGAITGVTVTVERKGQKPYSVTWTADMAKKAGLLGKSGPWSQYPERMMMNRARSWALRDTFADALCGMNSADELSDEPTVANDVQELLDGLKKS